MNHGTNDGEHRERSEKTESKAERLEKKAENRERGEACTELASGTLNKNISAATLEKRLSRKSGATGYGVASADSLLPLDKKSKQKIDVPEGISKAEYVAAVKQMETLQKEQKPIAVIAQGVEASPQQIKSDGGGGLAEPIKAAGPDEVIAQIRPDKTAVHEGVMTGLGHLHGVVNFASNTLVGIGDTVRMASAAERKVDLFQLSQPDMDPEGTEKLHDTCQGLAMGSRVLLQYSTTLNKESPFYGNNFDPEARQVAEKLSQAMPERLKQEISQFKNSDTEARAAKSTELLLDIYTCAEAGGMMLSKAGQMAKETKVMSQISNDMQMFASKLKELPASESVSKMSEYLNKSLPKFGPELASDGPSIKQVKATNHEAEDQVLKMVKHSDRGKSFDRGGDKAREAKQLDKMRESFQIEKLMSEGWKEKHEAKTVKHLRDKGETITKNEFEGTFPSDSPYRRQTDAKEWELKSVSKVKERGDLDRALVEHAKDGADKFTGKEHVGRVLIDAREQSWLTEKVAEKNMRQALLETPKLKEIRIIGKDQKTGKPFDIGMKSGQKEVIRF